MSAQVIVYGYIEILESNLSRAKEVLQTFEFDSSKRFTNIFSEPNVGFESSLLPFAGSFKNLDKNWDEWLDLCEKLMIALRTVSASITVEHEFKPQTQYYYKMDDPFGNDNSASWTRYITTQAPSFDVDGIITTT